MKSKLTPEDYDEVVSALLGNGVLCTTVSPTGLHVPTGSRSDVAHKTQHFVMAGRRRSGPRHPLINLGSISRRLSVFDGPPLSRRWEQEMDTEGALVVSIWDHQGVQETNRSLITMGDNLFLTDTVLHNTCEQELEIKFVIEYRAGEPDAQLQRISADSGVTISYEIEDLLGELHFDCIPIDGAVTVELKPTEFGVRAICNVTLEPGSSASISTWIHFSDRMQFQPRVTALAIDDSVDRHEADWQEFWSRSEVVTGDNRVDAFRQMSLYTLRCQMTPWSIPPALAEPYWGGGFFHDEMYPFLGLLSSNYGELAKRIPYFRLTTLPAAKERAISKGALYPWSSTEIGEERDPHGHWLSERFHLGQFAVCINSLWNYNHDILELEDLYPVLSELARYFELNMLERDEEGRLVTRRCTDFDESVGAIQNGPFTINSAIYTLLAAADAAISLNIDTKRAKIWRTLANELNMTRLQVAGTIDLFEIPEQKSLHYSILGPVFPFGLEIDSERAVSSAEMIHLACASTRGWKPGHSEVFDGHNWMWVAGHLGIVHAMQGDAERAWEAIRLGPASAGPFLSPNEHRDQDMVVQVPWFTTGCGGWLAALNSLFLQVSKDGTKLLPAVPPGLQNWRFRDLLAHDGVTISGEMLGGVLVSLTARSDKDIIWTCKIRVDNEWLEKSLELKANTIISLVDG